MVSGENPEITIRAEDGMRDPVRAPVEKTSGASSSRGSNVGRPLRSRVPDPLPPRNSRDVSGENSQACVLRERTSTKSALIRYSSLRIDLLSSATHPLFSTGKRDFENTDEELADRLNEPMIFSDMESICTLWKRIMDRTASR